MRKVVKPVLELLAGVPTIVFGYFALTFFTPEILSDVLALNVGVFNGLSAGIIMGLLVLPTIASVAEDAMSAVPASLREGAFGLGAGKLQVSLRIVFPAALSGIVAALVLGASRAIGETVIVLIAGGQSPNLERRPARELPVDGRLHRRHRRAVTSRPARSSTRRSSRSAYAVRADAGAEPRLDPARPQVPAGVRMTGAQIAAAARNQMTVIPRLERRGRRRTAASAA